MIVAVKEGMKYRVKKGNPVSREEMDSLNSLVRRIGFVIPELNKSDFLSTLPSPPKPEPEPVRRVGDVEIGRRAKALNDLRKLYIAMHGDKDTQARGFALERLLNDLFAVEGLAPRGSFRVADGGEQIDGSFELNGSVFLLEAKWKAKQSDAAELYVLKAKVDGKSTWTRGLFLSVNGFTSLAADTFQRGKVANLITIDGLDLMLILEDRWTLVEALRRKLRHAGETGEIYLSLASASR